MPSPLARRLGAALACALAFLSSFLLFQPQQAGACSCDVNRGSWALASPPEGAAAPAWPAEGAFEAEMDWDSEELRAAAIRLEGDGGSFTIDLEVP